MTDPVEAVQAAAVDRALTDEAVAREHLSLAGALEPAREAARDPFAAVATAVLAVRLRDEERVPAAPATPGADADLAARGAAVAHRRFGVAADRAADLADAPVGTVLTALD